MTTTKYNSLTFGYGFSAVHIHLKKIAHDHAYSYSWLIQGIHLRLYSCAIIPWVAIPQKRLTVNLGPRRQWYPDSVDSFTGDAGNLAHVPVVPDSVTVLCTVHIQFIYS